MLPPIFGVPKLVNILKSNTSVALKNKFKFLEQVYPDGKLWSTGYFMSTVGIDESIIGKVIECSHRGECTQNCTLGFKIILEELQFYRRMNLPLPHLCPNCRHYERLSQRNPMKLWHRKCMKEGCDNEFETSYAPERPEIVYCEKCYQKEVY